MVYNFTRQFPGLMCRILSLERVDYRNESQVLMKTICESYRENEKFNVLQ